MLLDWKVMVLNKYYLNTPNFPALSVSKEKQHLPKGLMLFNHVEKLEIAKRCFTGIIHTGEESDPSE